MLSSVQFLFKTFTLTLGKFSMPVPYWQAAALVFLIFLLILTMATFRKHYVNWSLKGGIVGVFFGFFLALILEGFLLIGGRTVLTGFLGWKNPPAFLAQTLDAGKSKLVQVLGTETQISTTSATIQNAVNVVQSLNPSDLTKIKNIICAP
jgi:hypothetical protein